MAVRKIVHIDEEKCNGCGQCVPACAEGALQIIDGKARLVSDKYCDGLGACLGHCPRGAITIVEREAEDFDEAPVEELKLRQQQQQEDAPAGVCDGGPAGHQGGCPSSRALSFDSGEGEQRTVRSSAGDVSISISSQLRNWPLQMFLMNPGAEYLQGADLLLAADCVPAAYPNFHLDMLKGKVLIIGCPKQDDLHSYVEKLAGIIKSNSIKSITVAYMEVACCSALYRAVLKAVDLSGREIPVTAERIGMRGERRSQGGRHEKRRRAGAREIYG